MTRVTSGSPESADSSIGGERVSRHHLRQFLTHQDHRGDRDVVERAARADQELLAGDRSGL
ncbi:hypothetical protein ACFWJ4_22255 [Kitasatospora sp. NPDC127067]|uniref:hypothetical protein n=1 Tax=Kitasatospora sp. NPDC127067 TaxID=3347126 RepID=UPI00365CB4C6